MVTIKTNCPKLSELRIKQGMSQVELAKVVGVSKQSINGVERGRTNPAPLLAKNIAEALGISFDDIFSLVEGD